MFAAFKKRPPDKGKAFKAARGSKFILFIGDEGTILVHLKDNVVQSRHFVPDAEENHLNELREVLAENPKSPIMLVVDSMDQSYIQQTLPPVSSLSVSRLINRRLDRDFGSNDIKGAILLGREKTGRKDWNFMMIALENSAQLGQWLEFIASLPNRFMGIHLVSVEAELFIKYLEHAMGPSRESTGSEWTFLVSHNKVGGFRQVILRNGRIIFTRMAQPIGESTPEVIAGNIEQEMLSTIEYMRRLSFNAQSGLDIYIIASSAIKPVIDQSKFEARSVTILSPYEVAQYLGIEGATQPTDQFGDVILASVIGASRKHILTLSTPQSKAFDGMYMALQYQRAAAVLVTLGVVAYAGSIVYDIYAAYDSSSELEHRKVVRQQGLDQLRTDIKNADMDVEQATDLIDLYQQLGEERLSPVPFIVRLETVIKPPINVKEVDWAVKEPSPKSPGPSKMVAVLTMTFPGVTTLDAFKTVSRKLMEDLKTAFDGYSVAFTKLPPVYSEKEKVDITFGSGGTTTASEASGDLDVQLTIEGDAVLKPPADTETPVKPAIPVQPH